MSEYLNEIIDYLEGRLDSEESDVFLSKLKSDKEVKEEYLFLKDMKKHFYAKYAILEAEADTSFDSVNELAEELVNKSRSKEKNKTVLDFISNSNKNISDSIPNRHQIDPSRGDSREPGIRRKLIIWSSGAAAAIILIIVFLNNFNSLPLKEKVFAEYHISTPELSSLTVRDAEQTLHDKFNHAVSLYNKNEFEDAYDRFYQIYSQDTSSVQVLFYAGLAQFEAGLYDEASELFNKTVQEYNEYNIEAKWFLSLCCVMLDDLNKAEIYARELSVQDNVFREKAERLLDDLED
jgi:TolA-binding protein